MRRNSWASLLLFILIEGMTLKSFANPPKGSLMINWRVWSPAIFEVSRSKNRLILIYAKMSRCHWCQNMDSLTLSKPEVIEHINNSYIPVLAEFKTNLALWKHYKIIEIPSFIIIDKEGRERARFTGYFTPQALLRKFASLHLEKTNKIN